jgi:hypothetical protein
MSKPRQLAQRSSSPRARRRALATGPEVLESRLLLYAPLGDQWTYGSRITYSLIPDGTSVGTTMTSSLFQTLDKNYAPVTWEQQIESAASIWESAANINLALVSDSGAPVGTAGNQQDDPRFGDIRIGAIPLSSGTLAVTFLPPPSNGGTDAGDIFLNSNINWQINSNYDLMTVVAHEFGHALGLGESTVSNAVMYGTYSGIRQALASDDIAGIQSIYAAHQFDRFNNAGTRDNMYYTATNISGFVNSSAQIAIPGLDITTGGDSEWFYVNVPATTTGTMTVTVQSSNLSSLSPKLQLYNSSLGLIGQAGTVGSFGATIRLTTGVQSGQGYYFKVSAAGGPGPIGAYGLLVNFGSQPQAPIPPPNTVVAAQPDQEGSGLILNGAAMGSVHPSATGTTNPASASFLMLGGLSGWGENYIVAPPVVSPSGPSSSPASPATNPVTTSTPAQELPAPVISTVPTTITITAAPDPTTLPNPHKLVHKKHVNQPIKHHHKHGDDEIGWKHR